MASQEATGVLTTLRRRAGWLVLAVALAGFAATPAIADDDDDDDWDGHGHRGHHHGHHHGHRHGHHGDTIIIVPSDDYVVLRERQVIVIDDDDDDVVIWPRWVSPDPALSIRLTIPLGD